MLEVSNNFKFASLYGTTHNEIIIFVFNNPTAPDKIKNADIVYESMKLSQSICDESDLKFGGCIASEFEIELAKDIDLTGKYITVVMKQTARSFLYPGSMTYPSEKTGAKTCPGGGEYTENIAIFSGEVYSCKLNKNRITRTLVAYDRLYWRGGIDCTKWYQSWHKANADTTGKVTLGALRLAILNRFQIVQAENNSFSELVKLPADDFPVYMIEAPVTVSDLLCWICEINGCFMALNGNGNAEYIFIGDDRFTDGKDTETYDFYMNVETEDYSKSGFDSIYISGFESGCVPFNLTTSSTFENMYYMDGNSLLTKGYTPQKFSLYLSYLPKDEMQKIQKNFTISYTPLTLTSQARLWVQLGDRIVVNIKWYDLNGKPQQTAVTSLVLSRNLTGIQALKDEITADGENMRYTEEYFDEEDST